MIPSAYITAWRKYAPWKTNEQVEQDLVICRALISIFSEPVLKDNLAFRGGTALYKLFFQPPARYSEDIDMVQIKPGPIGDIFDRIRRQLSFIAKPRIKQGSRNNTMIFSFESEIPPKIPMKLKIEINCREHFNILGLKEYLYKVDSQWHAGLAKIKSYDINEMLGTKMRALYQRKKGRDLFDLWYSLLNGDIFPIKVISAFNAYLEHDGLFVSKKEYLDNLALKIKDPDFRSDTETLLRPDINFDIDEAYELVKKELLGRM
ncbi:MAG: nucleotidyl transferase AbiEii/AbiGii toxin family protein [Bacteroidetes bacterium]|nr:nucleotidyl transferase AbiEii/AbiGii toxin family protein [Bacteroidota bacterium]